MVIKEKIWYDPAAEKRVLHIYLPNNYRFSEEKYPVMYFFDGHNLFNNKDATYGKSWGLKEFLDQWSKNMIIVGVECSHKGNHRLSEYCPYPAHAFGEDIKGEGKETMDWIVNTLKPYIDGKYRTWPHREATAIGGSSMGGLMSLYAVTAYNEVFSKAACVSSSIGLVHDCIFEELEQCSIVPDTKVFLSWGEKESGGASNPEFEGWFADNNRGAAAILTEKGAQTKVFFQPGGGHCEADWEKQIPFFMGFLWLNQ